MSASDKLEDFFQFIYGDMEGFVYAPVVDQDGRWVEKMFPWPKAKQSLVNYCMLAASQGKEVYYGPAMYREAARPNKSIVLGSRVLWADFDGNAPAEWTGPDTPASDSGPGESRPAASVPPPSITVQSSGERNQHVYWLMDEVVTDVAKLESMNRAIAYDLNADTSGWDATQILRPPFTVNHGYKKPERKGKTYDVVISEETDKTYSSERFRRYCSTEYGLPIDSWRLHCSLYYSLNSGGISTNYVAA